MNSRTPARDVVVIAKDLALKTAAKSLYQDVKSSNLTVDVLVNNAGVAYGGAFTAMDTDAVPRMVLLNAATLAIADAAVRHRHGRARVRDVF